MGSISQEAADNNSHWSQRQHLLSEGQPIYIVLYDFCQLCAETFRLMTLYKCRLSKVLCVAYAAVFATFR